MYVSTNLLSSTKEKALRAKIIVQMLKEWLEISYKAYYFLSRTKSSFALNVIRSLLDFGNVNFYVFYRERIYHYILISNFIFVDKNKHFTMSC